jgi:hypothetical protein
LRLCNTLYLLINGFDGEAFSGTGEFLKDVTKLTDYGKTTRGLSDPGDEEFLNYFADGGFEIAFMLNVADDDYLTLKEARRIWGDDVSTEHESGNEVDIDELIGELEADKKKHDQERLGQGGPSRKKKAKSKGKKKKAGKAKEQTKPESADSAEDSAEKQGKGKGRKSQTDCFIAGI